MELLEVLTSLQTVAGSLPQLTALLMSRFVLEQETSDKLVYSKRIIP